MSDAVQKTKWLSSFITQEHLGFVCDKKILSVRIHCCISHRVIFLDFLMQYCFQCLQNESECVVHVIDIQKLKI